MKRQYELYKDKGFEVISISIDKSEAAWRKALEEEKLQWPNLKVLDLSSTSTSLSYRSVGTVNAILPQLGYAECFIDDLQTQTA